jgi:hypothetical protein
VISILKALLFVMLQGRFSMLAAGGNLSGAAAVDFCQIVFGPMLRILPEF